MVAAVCALGAIGLGYFYVSLRGAAPRASTRSYILPPEKVEFLFNNERGTIALSPDGKHLAFTAHLPDQHDTLWVLALDSQNEQPLAGTDNAAFPFWSPDSRDIGFFADGKLKKIGAGGGSPQVLADARAGRGGAWNREGTIVFAPDTLAPLLRIPASGGTAVALTHLSMTEQENSHRWPDFLPYGKHFLYYARSDQAANSGVFVGSLDSKERRLLFHSAWPAMYARPGYLLFARDDTLMAQAFDARKLETSGELMPLADHLTENAPSVYGVFSASQNDLLVLHRLGGASGGSQLLWFDREGNAQGALGAEAVYLHPSFSPEGSRLAYGVFNTNGTSDIWVLDLERKTRTRVTFGPGNQDDPVWTPDGKLLFYSSTRGPIRGIYKKAADGSGGEDVVLEKTAIMDSPIYVARDSSYLAFTRNEGRGQHVWVLPLGGSGAGERTPVPADDPNSAFADFWPSISPDGKWMAYTSSESGPYQVYIRPFPTGPGKWQVSTDGGSTAVWRGDGKEIIFDTERTLMAVDVAFENGAPRLGTPHALFKATPFLSDRQGAFAVAGNGKRIVLNAAMGNAIKQPLTLVTNWDAELKK